MQFDKLALGVLGAIFQTFDRLMCVLQVTGGSSGIGKAIAIECYRQGAFITLVARDEVSTQHFGRHQNSYFYLPAKS